MKLLNYTSKNNIRITFRELYFIGTKFSSYYCHALRKRMIDYNNSKVILFIRKCKNITDNKNKHTNNKGSPVG